MYLSQESYVQNDLLFDMDTLQAIADVQIALQTPQPTQLLSKREVFKPVTNSEFNAFSQRIGGILATATEAGARLAIDTPVDERFTALYEVVLPKLMEVHPDLEVAANDIVSVIQDSTQLYDALRSHSTEPVLAVEAIMECETSSKKYKLANALAGNGLDSDQQQILMAMLHLEKSKAVSTLLEQLKSGQLDVNIAVDCLTKACKAVNPENGTQKLAEFAQFMAMFGQQPLVESNQRLAEMYLQWPSDNKQYVDAVRQSLITSITVSQAIVRERFSSLNVNWKEPPRHMLGNSVSELGSQLLKAGVNLRKVRPTLQYISEYLSRSNRLHSDSKISKILDGADVEIQGKKHFTLTRMDHHSGDTMAQDSEAFESMKREYLNAYGAKDELLERDIDRILSSMERLDFKNSMAYGAKKFLQAIKIKREVDGIRTYTQHSIWEYKPSTAYGLSLVSENSRNVRVLFTILENNTLGLLSIFDRRDLNTQLRRLSS